MAFTMKIKPETADEINSVNSIEGIWERIEQFAQHDATTHNCLRVASDNNLSREGAAIILAFEALKRAEYLFDELLHQINTSTNQVLIKETGNFQNDKPLEFK